MERSNRGLWLELVALALIVVFVPLLSGLMGWGGMMGPAMMWGPGDRGPVGGWG